MTRSLRYNTLCLWSALLLLSSSSVAQVCEDSVVIRGLFTSFPIIYKESSLLALSNGNNAIVAGRNQAAGNQLSIVLTNAEGELIAAQSINSTDPACDLNIHNLAEAPSGGIVAFGQAFTADGYVKGMVVVKLDNQLTIEWSRLIKRNIDITNKTNYYPRGIHCDNSGNVYFSAYADEAGVSGSNSIFFAALDAQGNLIWSRGMGTTGTSGGFAINAVTSIDDKVLFTGPFSTANNPGLIGFSFNRNTGQLIRCNSGIIQEKGGASGNMYINVQLFPRQNDFYYAFGKIPTSGPQTNSLVRLLVDTAFNFSKAIIIKGNIWSPRHFGLSRNGLLAFTGLNGIPNDFAVIDSSNKVLISKKVGNSFFQLSYLMPLRIGPDEKGVILSVRNSPSQDTLVRIKVPFGGDSAFYSCAGKDTLFFSIEPTTLQRNVENPVLLTGVVHAGLFGLSTSAFALQEKEFCKVKSSCSSVTVTGNNSFCTGSQQTFIARKNTGCLKRIEWNTDTIPATIMARTDTSITLLFNHAWKGNVIASLSGCGITDIMGVDVSEPGSFSGLGADRVLCPGDSIELTAPAGFSAYTWNTGETSASIKAKNPGAYFVTITDACGNQLADTVMLKEPGLIFPVLDNQVLCAKDSFFIPTLSGFSHYTWEPSAGTIRDSIYYFVPDASTYYKVQARDQYGCWWQRDFLITVQTCPRQIAFATAFTPNRDGNNDFFGPVVKGRWLQFSMTVYNRWGQVVFSSVNPLNKWDGTFKGALSPAGVYTWVCKYQFQHGPPQMEKNTVVLIR